MRKLPSLVLLVGLVGCLNIWADGIQITDGISGTNSGADGSCASNCDFTPNNLLVGTDVGLYITSKSKSAAEELLVFFVPNDTTDLLGGVNPLGTIGLYNSSLAAITETTSSTFATPTNASAFGLGTGSLAYSGADGFFGSITSSSGSDKPAADLGIGLSSSINMSNVTTESNSGTDTFGVYVFLITANMGGQDLLDIKIADGLPQGTFVSTVTDTGLANPNSSAGVAESPGGRLGSVVPEPSSMLLLGSGLLFACVKLRKKLARS